MGNPELSLKARRLLRVMNRKKTDVSTRDLTRETGLPNYDVGHHMGRLGKEGFVEHTGEKNVGAPNDAKVYAITDAGERHAEQVLGELKEEAEVEGIDNSAVVELRENVSSLQSGMESAVDRVNDLEQATEAHDEKMDTIDMRLDAHKRKIEEILEVLD